MTEALDNAQITTSLEERLARARAARNEVEKARAEREAERRLLEQVEEAELAARDAKAIEEAEIVHGPIGKKIAATYTPLGVIIVKRPHTALFRRFQDAKEINHKEATKLVRPSVVYPSLDLFDQWMEEVPAALFSLAKQCAQLSGAALEEAAGK